MKCPTDSATLVMSERSGIEIDYCPECRGVWLDRGELDKILERAAAESSPPAPAAPTAPIAHVPPQASQQPYQEPRYSEPRYDDRSRDDRSRYEEPRYDDRSRYGQQPYRKKKKEHWLSELFD